MCYEIYIQVENRNRSNLIGVRLPVSLPNFCQSHNAFLALCILFASLQSTVISQPREDVSADSSEYLAAVETFAQNVLENGRDQYGGVHSPLFMDGMHAVTNKPVSWKHASGEWIISNFGSQQNLMRTLVGLSKLTGDPVYKNAAAEAVQYMFDHHTDKAGLLYWGGHQFVDLLTMENQFKGRPHELKNNFPFYEFMWEVNAAATRKMLRAMWNAHILNWDKLDLNRHGEYDLEMGKLWDHGFHQPTPFFESEGLTFINAGTDMVQSALALYHLGNEQEAKTWGVRLYKQYVRARHPETNLGVYQYSRPKKEKEPPAEGPLIGELTYSSYGDRAQNQFGEIYGEIALEGNMLWGGRMETLYGKSPVMILHLAEQLEGTDAGKKLLDWTIAGLKSYSEYAYVPEENHYKPMWTDGTDLTGHKMPRTGYYGEKGTPFQPLKPNGDMMLAMAKAVRLSKGDPVLWTTFRNQFKAINFGEPGKEWNGKVELNLETTNADPKMLVMVLEIYEATENREFLKLAEQLGDNILEQKFHDGYFRPSSQHKYIRFDSPEPLALLLLEEARQGKTGEIPPYLTGYGSTDGEPSIDGRPTDETYYEETFE